MKKILATLLSGAVLCSFAAFAGCTGGGNEGGTPPAGDGTENQKPEETPDVKPDEQPETPASTKLTGKIYVVGDSTVCSFDDKYYLPRYGYGTQLYRYFNCDAGQVVNLALSGRSSLSFLSESNYNTLKSGISAGDYLVIGFGHNDEKSDDPARFTNPNKSYTDETSAGGASFRKTLYDNYVKLAKDKGATPILCTPIVRYDAKGEYTGTSVHNTAAGDYAQAIKTLGEDTQTTVVDLTEITRDLYKADNAAAVYFHAHTTYTGEGNDKTPAGMDATHINEYGAKTVAYNFAQAIKDSECTLKNHMNLNAVAPTFDVDYKAAIVASYRKPDYTPFDPAANASAKIAATGEGENAADWYKTAFGDLGGKNNYQYYTAAYADGKFTMGNDGEIDGVTKVAGKFTDTYDTVCGVFTRIPADKDFTARATVKVTQDLGSSKTQTGFGMMLRDDIYMNLNVNTITSNYVAAGVQNGCAVFSRENTVITRKGSGSIEVNKTYGLSIERVGQVVTVTCGSTVEKFTDFDFVAVDNDYMYLCLFATRGIVAEFSGVSFEITGESQGA